ncbi:O-methyltransferase [Vagococcus zengguangii]|uniref:tRNA 5-hydroxyuridine methyltransferase n=1 Tax=Vagococcus zengguangii TaxID=2571750 RepID=A0A4D7CPB4_9ENTE|nr:O-methyltransferase [Vagococcus zengguangii]QCI85945.1 O-methyltransferase [Vagococcus zengguangii]TLG80310.1 O-methyltransferase [Vagococcus zengguangii]
MRNPMMHRPVVKQEIVDFMRNRQKQLTGPLREIQRVANENDVPIIPHETVVFLQFLLKQLKPKEILEIGAAIGFSSSLMSEYVVEGGHVTTIDRFDVMIRKARANYKALGLEDKITLLEGDAKDILPTLDKKYDFIFMDSAKSKYIEFLPYLLDCLEVGGVIMIDDVLQAGTILQPIEEIPRNQRTIYRKLNLLFDTVLEHPDLTSSLIPLGDGVLLITKDKEKIEL